MDGGMDAGGRWLRWAFVGPTLLFLVAFNVFPLAYNVVLGFTDAELVRRGWEWHGGASYARLFGDPEFAQAVRRTGLFVLLAVACELALGFGVALALRRRFRGRDALLTALLVPMMLSPAVMGLSWNLILDGNYGILNHALAALGLPEPQWTTDRDLKFASILIIDVWMWTPFMLLVSMAALNAIPGTLYEAAEVDRAGTWTVFRRITLPLCAPLLGLAALLRATDAWKQFDLVMAVTGPNDERTQTVSTLLYQIVFRDHHVGLGSAYACLVLVIVIAGATLFTRTLEQLQRGSA